MAQPAAMARCVEQDLKQREAKLQATLREPGIVQRMFTGSLTVAEVNQLADAPFNIYAFEHDTAESANILIFWNNNAVVGVCDQNSVPRDDRTLFRNNGVFLKRCIRLPRMNDFQTIVALLPIASSYALQNEYLPSAFAAADYIPASTLVSDTATTGSIAVKDDNGRPLFWLKFADSDLPRWIPDPLMITGLLLALLFSFTWVQLLAMALSRAGSPWLGFGVVALAVGLLLGSVYVFGLPFHLEELAVFSTQLYAASSLFPSLGVLFIHLFALLWLLSFLLLFVRPASGFGWLGSVGLTLLMICGVSFSIWVLRGLVIDSRITFDVGNFYSINFYTVVGLMAVGLIAGNSAALVYWCNKNLSAHAWKYGVLLLTVLLSLWVGKPAQLIFYGGLWLLVSVLLLDLRLFVRSTGLFASGMIFWAAFVSLSATVAIEYFNEIKEGYKRKLFAENIVRQRDDMMEFLFAEVADSISENNSLKAFLRAPSGESRTTLEELLTSNYLKNFGRYETEFYFFGPKGEPYFNADTLSESYFLSMAGEALPTTSKYLFFRENARDGHYYLAAIPVRDSGTLAGFAFIDMTLKKAANATVYPELLQSSRLKELQSNNNYIYAIYAGRKLITQVSDHPFPLYRRRDNLREGAIRTIRGDGYDVVQYKVDKDQTVSIVVQRASVFRRITLFSYMLGVLMIFGLFAAALKVYFFYLLRRHRHERLFHPTIRKRIHYAMLSIVFISFLIIGAVTIYVFVDRYNESNKNKLRAAIKRIERSIQTELKNNNVNDDPIDFELAAGAPKFRKFINDLANSQSIDINVYNSLGALMATSQDEIYNKMILARLMMPDAYYKLSTQNKVLLLEKEMIGKLGYLSGYVPIRSERGEAIGYVNVPYFSSQKELNYQISNILVALINFYAIIFLISSFFALVITNWITRGLQLIIERFQKFNLGQNEPLVWEHQDEIGLLVGAYNSMVKKVEESTSLLARSERETAWREMARQVAHEIKNPLTPMKLNIQYLQRALQNNHPQAKELTENVAATLIEQIDNLSHIASAFSDFARMPEARPEPLLLNDLLQHAVELYRNDARATVIFNTAFAPLTVYADKSQLLRVMTNLIQNAIEAIPDGQQGKIEVNLKEAEHAALITVTDNGTGIPDELRERIFSPYFTTKGSGTGLGLAMTRRIIEFWKGDISFSNRPAGGAQFAITLPLLSVD